MKILLVTGSYPPDTCGVGDYTFNLAEALLKKGTTVEVITKEDWNITNTFKIIKRIKSIKPNVVHIQYPTAGFGAKMSPQILSLSFPGMVTIHEITQAHILRKLSLYPFAFRSRHIIFTTSFERDFAARHAPWIYRRSSVIPIGSNIKTTSQQTERNPAEILYFGLFRPKKGLEDIFALASLVKQMKLPYFVRMVGKPSPDCSSYVEELYRRAEGLPIKWDQDLDDKSVADLLSRSFIAYMPFPDGASDRRGSLLALLANGVVTITTRGAHTPPSLEQAVLFSQSPEQALRLVEKMQTDSVLRKLLSDKGRAYANKFNWDTIAQNHIKLYEKLFP